ncbi:MAG TPA: bifunctional shikimate kinase/3-dehydroquinate synthase [Gaiellaceae bacterium]|nr:bifunctional shikimate kinase/3-dehydroquinate synthase [Gaiellaceae bacterium]
MGAGKTTIGREVARLTQRPFVDTDEVIQARHGPIARIFEEEGEGEFRRLEEDVAREALISARPAVIALGGGAVTSSSTRDLLREQAYTVWLVVEPDDAWSRVRATDRPLAQDERDFRRLFADREGLYASACDARALTVEDVLLGSLRISSAPPGLPARAAVVADEHVLRLHGPPLGARVHPVPAGEAAKSPAVLHRLWAELRMGRAGVLVAFGGGSTTDVAGFAAATYLRGVEWVAWPTTLVGQVDAAIGGKTGINLEHGKNLVGAFHFPSAVVIDPSVLSTLPERERRNGMAEVVKTGLLAGKEVWNLADEEMIRACAAFKSAVVLADPYERTGRRAVLNLGHTFAHALETASGYSIPHGEAVALGLLAALRLSGLETDVVQEVLRPVPVRVDPERAWAALERDKKALDGRIRLVLLERPGEPVFPVELPADEVRRALAALIAD